MINRLEHEKEKEHVIGCSFASHQHDSLLNSPMMKTRPEYYDGTAFGNDTLDVMAAADTVLAVTAPSNGKFYPTLYSEMKSFDIINGEDSNKALSTIPSPLNQVSFYNRVDSAEEQVGPIPIAICTESLGSGSLRKGIHVGLQRMDSLSSPLSSVDRSNHEVEVVLQNFHPRANEECIDMKGDAGIKNVAIESSCSQHPAQNLWECYKARSENSNDNLNQIDNTNDAAIQLNKMALHALNPTNNQGGLNGESEQYKNIRHDIVQLPEKSCCHDIELQFNEEINSVHHTNHSSSHGGGNDSIYKSANNLSHASLDKGWGNSPDFDAIPTQNQSTHFQPPTHTPQQPYELNTKIDSVSDKKQGIKKGKEKKVFLRRGSRKEPSSIHRLQNNSKANICDLPIHLKVASNDPKKDNQVEKMEKLEKMQRDQIKDLEKRMDRREQARDQIIQREKRSIEKKKRKTDRSVEKEEIENLKVMSTYSDTSSDSGDNEEDVESKGDHLYSSTDGDSEADSSDSNDGVDQCPIEVKGCQSRSQTGPRSKADTNKRKKSIKKHAESTLRSHLKKINEGKKGSRDETQLKRHQSTELEDQWQVIKSMRKRQEVALRATEKEREEVRSWAFLERETLQKWIDNQRTLIQKEKQRMANTVMVSKRKMRQDELEEKATVAVGLSHKRVREEIESLKATVHKQKIDADAAKSRQRLNEKRLRDNISTKEDRIRILEEEIDSVRNKHSITKENLDDMIRQRDVDSKARKRKKKKNAEKKIEQITPVEVTKKSTIDEVDPKESSITKEIKEKSDPFPPPNDTNESQIMSPSKDKIAKCKNDQEARHVLSSYQDLIEEPTEHWLQRHLEGLAKPVEVQKEDKSLHISQEREPQAPVDHSYVTPSYSKKYDPDKYNVNPQKRSTMEIAEIERLEMPETKKSKECKGRNEQTFPDGRRNITYQNGTEKDIFVDGTTVARFTNGDVKTTYRNVGVVVYYYAKAKTSHTTHPDGLQIFEFATGQTERHYPDGRKEIAFPDGTRMIVNLDGMAETNFPDGVRVVENKNGCKEIINI